MCRDLMHPNARRCPSSMGEARNARDRLRYATTKASTASSPVDTATTEAVTLQPTELPLEDIAADVRRDIHTAFEAFHSVNLGQSALDPDNGAEVNWRGLEERVREVGAQVENRAEELSGTSAEDIQALHDGAIARVKDDVEPLIELSKATESQWREAMLAYNKACTADPDGDHDDLEAEMEALKAAFQEARLESENAAKALAADFGYNPKKLETSRDINVALRAIQQGNDPTTQGQLKALAEGRIRALQEVRDMGGETIEMNDNSSKRAAKVMAEVAEVYPTDWIRMSNATGDLRIKDTKGRAHYSSMRTQKTRKVMSERFVAYGDEQPDGGDWVRGVWTGSGWTNPLENPDAYEKYAGEADTEDSSRVFWYRPAFKTRRRWDGKSVEGKPPRGWTEAFETNRDGEQIRVFRQPQYYMSTSDISAELTIDKDKPASQWQDTPGLGTAIHEFAHRCEHVNPAIGRLEQAFLERRTTDADGNREPLQNIYGSSREKSRFDSFADKYMGKEYGTDQVTINVDGEKKRVAAIHREVLSTGMESLFAGAFGSLAGINGKTSDADMRSFVLGVLATS